MANNLFTGNNGGIGKATTAFSAKLNETNCTIVQRIGNPIVSWKPGRSINAITNWEVDGKYLIKMLADVDAETEIGINALAFGGSSGGGGGSSTYHSSSFTGTDGTNLSAYVPETGNAWTLFDGTWVLATNKAKVSGTRPVSTQWVALTAIPHTDVKITAGITAVDTAQVQLWLRASGVTGANCILVSMNPVASGTVDYSIDVYNIVSGTATKFVDATVYDLNNVSGALFTVEITLVGTALTIKLNGATAVTATVPTVQTNTNYGFGATALVDATIANNDVRIDSYVVVNPAG